MDELTAYIETLDYKVLVQCMTYNQSKYIEDALNGFVMQKTDFPYLCLVMDDASTDGEQKVVRDYLDKEFDPSSFKSFNTEEAEILIAGHKTNGNCKFAVYFLKKNLFRNPRKRELIKQWRDRCKYVALCEGDDYWISGEKLQLQVKFMDEHPDCAMSFHNAVSHWEDNRIPDAMFSNIELREYSGLEIYETWMVPTASTMIRKEVFDTDFYLHVKSVKDFCFGDICLFISASKYGKLLGFPMVGSVYRRHREGAVCNTPHYLLYLHHYAIFNEFGYEYKDYALKMMVMYAYNALHNKESKGKRKKMLFTCVKLSPIYSLKHFVLWDFQKLSYIILPRKKLKTKSE